jgi:mannonate dehydratase
MSDLKITEVRPFLMQFRGPATRLIVVKVLTSEPGLYGLGCATFTQRHRAVEAALQHHIGPAVVGRDPRQIEDIWQGLMVSGYWRNGPVLNNAISGIDMALWDIKGKLAGMPCHDLWGGKCRPGALAYAHADGPTPRDVADRARTFMDQGFQVIRCQLGGYQGLRGREAAMAKAGFPGAYFDPGEKLRSVPALFEYLRSELGEEVGLLYDVHERLAPIDAIQLAKRLEPCHLFFLEDILAPEDEEWLAMLRAQCATPIAMGELFNHPHEMTPFIARRLFDYVRVHISQIGGITPALKLAHLCEAFGIRTAWHCPGDVSPVGAAANVHLDLAMHNFGVQEWGGRSDEERAAFPGMPEVHGGMLTASGQPGLGVEFDEKLAARFPADDVELDWTQARLPDGTIVRP